MSRSRAAGSGASGVFCPGLGELLADLDRLEGQCAGLDGERQLVVVAVDDAAAHRLVDVGDLELARRFGAQPCGARHLQVEQLRRGDDEHQEDDGITGPVPEHERRTAQTGVGVRLPGCGVRGPTAPDRAALAGSCGRADRLAAAHVVAPGTVAATGRTAPRAQRRRVRPLPAGAAVRPAWRRPGGSAGPSAGGGRRSRAELSGSGTVNGMPPDRVQAPVLPAGRVRAPGRPSREDRRPAAAQAC